MRETDISKYSGKRREHVKRRSPAIRIRSTLKILWKMIVTSTMVFASACVIVGFSLVIYLISLSREPLGFDLDNRKLSLSSKIHCWNAEKSEYEETQKLYDKENRVWVDYQDIPQAMKDAVVAIEDKRFREHNGVDWIRTGSAIFTLVSGRDDAYGGSTITQQLIKNVTDDDEVSLTRKLREIFRAINAEKKYSKDIILEAYLNVVNFGNSCQGVEAAAETYFNKSIDQCSITECAAIAGITQNPSKWNPLVYPDNNKDRRELILAAMREQGKITEEQYKASMEESKNLQFYKQHVYLGEEEEEDDYSDVQSWYIDFLFGQLVDDLSKQYNISSEAAVRRLYTEGYDIYCAVDLKAQKIMEDVALHIDRSDEPDLQIGMSMVDMKGRLLATVGSADVKEGNLLLNMGTDTARQPGSSIKPLFDYAYSINEEKIHFSSAIEDMKIPEWYGPGTEPGPKNWDDKYHDSILVVDAIEVSANCAAARLMRDMVGVRKAYDLATTKMGFKHLDEEDAVNLGGLSIGGLRGGVTALEMASAYAFMGTGGLYYEPYSYMYVTDSNGKVILDNREPVPKRVYKEEAAAIINRLLKYNVEEGRSTFASLAGIEGWEIIGKTGTTDQDTNSWFCGVSPYASLAVWTGYEIPETILNRNVATKSFHDVMSRYLEDKEVKKFAIPETIKEYSYCTATGKLATSYCSSRTGYYTEDNLPEMCYGNHYIPNTSPQYVPPVQPTTAAPYVEETEPGDSMTDYVEDVTTVPEEPTEQEPENTDSPDPPVDASE